MINHEAMAAGNAFAGAFQNACMAAIRDQYAFRLYEEYILNPGTVFMLTNGQMELVVDTKLRRTTGQHDQFGINADGWQRWQLQNREPLPVVQVVWGAGGEAIRLNRELRPVREVAVLGYASYRPATRRLIAQWIDQIVVAAVGLEYVDTQLESYSTLSTILQEGIGIEQQLADQIEQRTLANVLANPDLNPNDL